MTVAGDPHSLRQELHQRIQTEPAIFSFLKQIALDGIWFKNLVEPEQEWMDEKFWQILGYDPQNMSSQPAPWQELIEPEDLALIEDDIQRLCRESDTQLDRIVKYRGAKGQNIWLQCRCHVIRDSQGNPIRLLGVHTDVTPLKLAERQLLDENKELTNLSQMALEAAPNAMLMVDSSGRILLCNRAMEQLFGYAREELTGQTIDILVPQSVREQHPGMLAGFFRSPSARTMGSGRDLVGQHKSGNMIPLEIGLNPVETEEGVMVIASIVDISERKRMAQRFRLAIEAAPNAMIMVNQQGRIVLINKATEQMFGYAHYELVNQPIDILVPDAVRHQHPQMMASFFRSPTTRSMGLGRELTGRRKDGSEIPVEIGLNPIDDGEDKLVIAAVVDISKRRQQEQQIARYTRELERSNMELDSFAYVASHDLKAPLRGISQLALWVEQDLEGRLERQTAEYLQLMQNRILRLETLLNDLLAYSRIGRQQSGQLTQIDVSSLVGELFALLAPPKSFKLVCHEPLPVITCNKAPFELVLRNLLSNAIKHREKDDGCIEVSAERSGNYYEFCVSDDGPTIPEKHHQTIFGIFQTLRSRDSIEGSGMGLAMVLKTLQHFDCRVRVESREQGGNRFIFTWPVAST